MGEVAEVSSVRAFDGYWKRYVHLSATCACNMHFSVYLPAAATQAKVPVVMCLSGLTCNDENFPTKSGAARRASQKGIALVVPDTSPRATDVAYAANSYDLGYGAGWFVNATEEPWKQNWRMFDYVRRELVDVLAEAFPQVIDVNRISLLGHGMGGHGALVLALRCPGVYRAVSCFAPVCSAANCPWGIKALQEYLGQDRESWGEYDATLLMKAYAAAETPPPLLIDQGTSDAFLREQLKVNAFAAAALDRGDVVLTLRMQPNYDHSYQFIATFIDDHIDFHARHLQSSSSSSSS